ncbi:ABC transporter substrate-binding protein [Geobacillus zalihae]|uniref:ABC transporter substrate-binding protein n=1 Tax=Geobacillus zalihae TaxID=213419 RepID=UPI0009BEA5D3|nr:sugar ABC transporter substrate-binding protein [Geobacillus zalihae]OQP24307.1 ABC transporter substrate-binding protein [Geobacillus zalihae]
MRKKSRSWLILPVFLLLFSNLLFGCSAFTGSSRENPTGGVEASKKNKDGTVSLSISTWGAPDELAVFKELVSNFEKDHPNIKLRIIHIPNDYSGKMNTMLAGGTAPDIVFVSDGDFGRWVKAGLFLNIQEMVDNSDIKLDDMWESALGRYKFDGKRLGQGDLYALPKDIGPSVLYYNKELFDKAGLPYPDPKKPMTMEEFRDLAIKLTIDKNKDGKPEQYGSGPIWWEAFVWSNGGEVLNKDRTEFVLNSPEAVEALQFVADMTFKYHAAPDPKALQAMSADQMFETGRVAMVFNGRWMVPTYRKLKFDWDVAPIPVGKTGISTGWSGSVGYAINKKTKFPKEAFEVIRYLAGEEGQKIQTKLGFAIPTYKSLSNTDLFLQPGQKPEHAEVFIEAAKNQRPGIWTLTPNNKWLDMLNQKLADLWNGKKSAKELMDSIKPGIDKALKEGNPELFEK